MTLTSRVRVRLAASAALCVLCVFAVNMPGLRPSSSAHAQDAKKDEEAAIAEQTKQYEARLGTTLRIARRGAFVVRGDNEQPEIENVAELCQATLRHFAEEMRCEEAEALPLVPRGLQAKGATGASATQKIEVFQFLREKGYLAFLDKVFARIRDDTVNDARLALMRRQRGFFVETPKPLLVQYQGPSDFATVRAQSVHKTSHLLLLSYRRAGAWMPWWLLEGFAVTQEFAVLKESRVYCIEVERPGEYAKPGTPEADEASKAQLEAAWRRRAKELVQARRHKELPVLAKLSLNELVLDDVVQSWSFVAWLRSERKLPEFVRAYKEKREFGAACEAALGASAPGVQEQWRQHVTR